MDQREALGVPFGGGGIIISGSVQKPCGCGTWGHSLVVALEVLGDPRGLFEPE